MLSTIDAQKFVAGHNDVIERSVVHNHIAQMKALQEKVRGLKVTDQSIEEVQKQFEPNQSALVQTIYNEIKCGRGQRHVKTVGQLFDQHSRELTALQQEDLEFAATA